MLKGAEIQDEREQARGKIFSSMKKTEGERGLQLRPANRKKWWKSSVELTGA